MQNPSPKNVSDSYETYVYPTIGKEILSKDFPLRKAGFLEVLLNRHSTQDLGPISKNEISELLFYSAKVRKIEIDKSGYFISKRSTPSAGARHPIDLLISIGNVNKKRNLHYYNSIDHSLNLLEISRHSQDLFFDEVNSNVSLNDACLIWFCIQKCRTGSKYENPESLYWKDTGALLYCIQLVSQFLNLKSCPLGTLAASSFPQLFSNDNLLSGGGILIGK